MNCFNLGNVLFYMVMVPIYCIILYVDLLLISYETIPFIFTLIYC